jgi:clan AA aspartic protease (TIGR02281 family)
MRAVWQALLIVALGSGLARAEIYQWTDSAGRVHFTQNLGQVPPQHRAAAEARANAPGRDPVQRVQTYATPAAPKPDGGTALGMQPNADETYRIPVSRAGTGMLVQVLLNETTSAPFLIDTGASDVLVPKSVADRLGLQVGPNTRTKRYATANGVVTHPVVMLRSVALGGARVENVPASITSGLQFGLLGLSFFNHFTYNIDAAQGIVTLKPNHLAVAGRIRGGRSEAQWRAEYRNLRMRIASVGAEKARTPSTHTREHRRLERRGADLGRELKLLEGEADQARVPMTWRH